MGGDNHNLLGDVSLYSTSGEVVVWIHFSYIGRGICLILILSMFKCGS